MGSLPSTSCHLTGRRSRVNCEQRAALKVTNNRTRSISDRRKQQMQALYQPTIKPSRIRGCVTNERPSPSAQTERIHYQPVQVPESNQQHCSTCLQPHDFQSELAQITTKRLLLSADEHLPYLLCLGETNAMHALITSSPYTRSYTAPHVRESSTSGVRDLGSYQLGLSSHGSAGVV